jgi:hypothetical protein
MIIFISSFGAAYAYIYILAKPNEETQKQKWNILGRDRIN